MSAARAASVRTASATRDAWIWRARVVILLAATVALLALLGGVAEARAGGAVAAGVSARPATTGPALFYTINVTISDSRITLSRHDLPRTYSARFNIRNIGKVAHSFTLGTSVGAVKQGVVVHRVVKAGSHAVAFLIQADFRGLLRYYSVIPSDRSKPGMKGTFSIS
jgi:hypothetical protein